jgi:chitin disaccharide deacetylase
MVKQLIVNADDFARSPGVSRGIVEAHRRGIVTSTTMMVNVDGARDAVTMASDCPALGLGLHLVFASWRPVLPPASVPGLVTEQGFFLDQFTFWNRAAEIPVDQLAAELLAQYERFVELVGRPPDHLDCHQFVHAHPRIFALYVELADRFRLPLRVPFSPEMGWKTQVAIAPFLEGSPPQRLEAMIDADWALIRERGVAHPDYSLTTWFGQDALTLDHLLHLLETLHDGVSEMLCHPGYSDETLQKSGYRSERELELRLLTHPAALERVRDLSIQLVTFDAVR